MVTLSSAAWTAIGTGASGRLCAGLARARGHTEWLIDARSFTQPGYAVRVESLDRVDAGASRRRATDWLTARARPAVWLGVGPGQARTHVSAYARDHHGRLDAVDELRVIGPRLQRVTCEEQTEEWSADKTLSSVKAASLADLRVLLVGTGSTGLRVGTELRRNGVMLAAIDADARGRTTGGKYTRLSPSLQGDPGIAAMTCSVESISALAVVKGCDAIVCCVDEPRARFAIAFLSALYLRPVIDVSSVVPRPDRGPMLAARRLDIRLTLPGACLTCVGGIDARSPDETVTQPQPSAASQRVDAIVTSLAVRALDGLCAGRTAQSVWLQVTESTDGLPRMRVLRTRARPNCPACRCRGCGDLGLAAFRQAWAEVQEKGAS